MPCLLGVLALHLNIVSEFFQVLQAAITGFKTGALGFGRTQLFEALSLHSQIQFEVLMSSGRAFMAQPQRDDGDVVAGLQQVHRRRMAKQMRRDGPSFERGAVVGGVGGGALQTVFDAKAGEPLPQMIDEQGGAGRKTPVTTTGAWKCALHLC